MGSAVGPVLVRATVGVLCAEPNRMVLSLRGSAPSGLAGVTGSTGAGDGAASSLRLILSFRSASRPLTLLADAHTS